jgi:hypothetical protein
MKRIARGTQIALKMPLNWEAFIRPFVGFVFLVFAPTFRLLRGVTDYNNNGGRLLMKSV